MVRYYMAEVLFWRLTILVFLIVRLIYYMMAEIQYCPGTKVRSAGQLNGTDIRLKECIGKEDTLNSKEMKNTVTPEETFFFSKQEKRSMKGVVWPSLTFDQQFHSHALKVGKRRRKAGYLVFGMPTVYRYGVSYLNKTLKSLVTNLPPEIWNEVVIVVFVSDFNAKYLKSVIDIINVLFREELMAGLIQIIKPISSFYPEMRNLPLLYGDSPERVKWRSKQSLDYSFLFYYCSALAKYYIQLEDDVIAVPNYFQSIKDYVNAKRNNWSVIEFGARGFIGMMYRSEHLVLLSKFVRMNYWTMPVDWTFRHFNKIFLYGNSEENKVKPPLFKHIGKKSSLGGQMRLLEDLKYDENLVEPGMYELKKNNPQATLTTTIKEYAEGHDITRAYSTLMDFFWGKSVTEGDTIDINVDTAVLLKKIVISSGVQQHPDDSLKDWELLTATDQSCESFHSLSSFTDTRHISFKIPTSFPEIKCIRLKITRARKNKFGKNNWLIIPEIALVK